VPGPVGRNVTDCAYFLIVLAGDDPHLPISIQQSGEQLAKPLGRDFKGVRVAMFKDLDLPWEPEIKTTIHAQRRVFESLGCIVDEAEPDLRDANECFIGWRHWSIERCVCRAMRYTLLGPGSELNRVSWCCMVSAILKGGSIHAVHALRIVESSRYQRVYSVQHPTTLG
jgi:Asp-tRNA(Asn)/Glu-tRNA(Gln) amidotransferase A subunit family amidase